MNAGGNLIRSLHTHFILNSEFLYLRYQEKSFSFTGHTIAIRVPDAAALRADYERAKATGRPVPFPYWARLWPSAIALCDYIARHSLLIKNKKVAELAVGLGLPSLLAAQFAHTVDASDHAPEAVSWLQSSIQRSGAVNMTARVADWNAMPSGFVPEILLLSDVNYDESEFETLQVVLLRLLEQGTIILLATPQRLVAKQFLSPFESYRHQHEEIVADGVTISVFVLKKHQ